MVDMERREFLAAVSAVGVGFSGCLSSGSSQEDGNGNENRGSGGGSQNGNGDGSEDESNDANGDGSGGDNQDDGSSSKSLENLKGPKHGDSLPSDSKPDDGYPPEFEKVPEERSIDTSSFETVKRNGVEVPLAPIEVTYYWYVRSQARFADARGSTQYERGHIYGAVSNPVNVIGEETESPVLSWPKDEPIVCYCGCPHHLSSILASKLISRGYKNVYVIDEGFGEWIERRYPMAGKETGRSRGGSSGSKAQVPSVKSWTIEGETNARHAGETAWAYHAPTQQIEATEIESDGSYEMELKFSDIDLSSKITVETPDYRVRKPLRELVGGIVSG